MNARQAEEKGYSFTGIYGRDKDEVKARGEVIKKAGNKTVLVTVPDSKYSRGGRGTGYSIYWIESEKNRSFRLRSAKIQKMKFLIDQKHAMQVELEKLNKMIAELDKEI